MKFSDEQITEALLKSGGSVRGAARILGCSRQTVQRRLDDDSFRGTIETARKETVYAVSAQLDCAAEKAVSTLMSILENTEDERTKIQAADKILTHCTAFCRISKMERDEW